MHRRPCVCFASLAALTGRSLGRLVPRPKGAMHGFGGLRHSPLGMTTLQLLRALKKRATPPHAVWRFSLGCHSRFFWRSQKKWGDKGLQGLSPLQSFYKGLRPYNIAPRPSGPRYASKRSLAARYAPRRSLALSCASFSERSPSGSSEPSPYLRSSAAASSASAKAGFFGSTGPWL